MLHKSVLKSLVILLFVFASARVFGQSCANYVVTRTTGTTYSSISASNPDYFVWRNTSSNQNDDNRTFQAPIGFDFWYLGVRYTHFSGNLNGIIDFSSSTSDGNAQTDYGPGHGGQFSIGGVGAGTMLALAPMYDDLWTGNSGTSPIASSCFYKTTGTSPNRILTIEWLNFDEFNSTTGSLNFQVKVYEGTGVITFEYGTMTLGSIAPTFACGINNTWAAGTPTAAQLLTQQTVNTNTFSSTAQNALGTMPASNSRLTFTPPTPTAAPTALSFTSVSSGGMTLNWTDNASNEIGYAVYYSEDGISYDYAGLSVANATSMAISGLQPNTLYRLKVMAVTDGGVSAELAGNRTTSAPSNITSIATGNWSATGTWSCSCIPSSGDNITIANGHTVTLNTNGSANTLTVGGGTSGQLTIGNDATSRSLILNGTLTVNAGATVTIGATAATHTMTLRRDVVNSGTLNLAPTGTRVCNVTFSRNGNQTVSGSGATTSFNNIVMNLGVLTDNTLEITSTNFTVPSGFLTMTRGIFKLSTGATFTFASAPTTILPNTTLWVNHVNATVSTTGGSLTLIGGLRASAGTLNIGNASGNDLVLQGGTVTVDGGNMNVAGFFTKIGISALMRLTVSSGTLTLGTLGSATAAGTFNMDEVGSTLTMTGGTIVIQNTGSGSLAFLNTGGTLGTKTGGTIQLGNASTPASQIFNVNSSQSIPSLIVGGSVGITCAPVTNGISIVNDLTVSSGSTFNLVSLTANRLTSGGTLTVAGTMTVGSNAGGVSGSNFPNNFTGFAMTGGTVNYNLVGGGQTIYNLPNYNNLILANTSSAQTVAGDLTVNGTLTTTTGGTLNMGTYVLGGSMTGVTHNGTLTTQNTSAAPIPSGKTFAGTVIFAATTGGQTIPGNTYGILTFSNTSGQQTASGNLTVTTLNHNTNISDTLNMATFAMVVTNVTNTGTIRTQNTSATPVSAGKTWGPTFIYDNTSGGQTVMAGTYTNLTIANTSGTQTASGTFTVSGSLITTAGGTLNMVTYLLSGPPSSITNNGTIRTQNTTINSVPSGITWSGTVQFDGATQPIVSGTYNNLTLAGSGNKTMLVGTTTINGNFTMNGTATTSLVTNLSIGGDMTISTGTTCLLSTFTANRSTAGGTLTVGGVMILSATTGGQTGSNFPANFTTISLTGSTVNYNASTGGQTIYSVPTYNTLTCVNTSGTQTAGGDLTVTTLNHNTNAANIFNMQSFTLTATTINNLGVIRTQNTSATPITSGLTIGGTVNYDAATGGQTIVSETYTNLTCGNTSGTQTAAGTLTVSGILFTTAGGTLNMGTQALGGALGTITNNGTIRTQNTSATPVTASKTWTGTITFDAVTGGQTIPAGTFATLTLGNTSGQQTATGALTVSTLNNNTNVSDTLNMATFALVVTTVNNSGTIRTQNSSGTPLTTGKTWGGKVVYDLLTGAQTVMAGTYNNLTLANTAGTQTSSGVLTINGTLVTTSGGTLNMVGNQMLGSLSGVTSDGVVRTQNTANPPIPNGKTWGGTVQFDGAAQTVSSGTYNHLILAVSGIKTLQASTTVNGNFTMSGTTTTTFVANVSIGGDMNIGTGTSCTLSSFTANRATGGGTLTVAGTLVLAGTTGGQTGSNFPANYTTMNLTGGTVNYNAATGSQTIYGVPTYTTLTCGNTSGTQTAGGNLTATTLNHNTNAADILNMQAFTLSATTVNNSGTIRTQNTSSTPLPSGVTIAGTISYDATTGGQTVMAGTYTNLTCGNTSGTQTAAGAFSVSGTLITTVGGTLNMGTQALAGTLTTVTNNGTIRTQNTSATPIPTGRTWAGTITFDAATGGQSIVTGTYNNLTSGNTSGIQAATGILTVNNILTTTAGGTLNMGVQLLAGTLTTITNNGTIRTQNTSATPIPTGKAWTGTVVFDATTGGQTIPSSTSFVTLTLGNTSGQQTLAANLIVTTLNHNTNASDSLNLLTFTLTVTTVNNTGTIRTQYTAGTPYSAGRTWGGKVVFDAAAAQTVSSGAYNNLTLANAGAKTTISVTVNGILSMEGTATVTAPPIYGASATLQYNTANARGVGAEFANPFTASGGVIIGNTGIITLSGGRAVNSSLVVNNGATFSLGANVLSGTGTFTLSTGGNIQIGNVAGITASGATGNIQVSGTRTYSTSANYSYSGTATQAFGNGLPNTVNNLVISNGNTAMALTGSLVVNGALTLTSAKIALGANTLTVNGTLGITATNCFIANGSSSLSFGGSGALGSNIFLDQTTSGTTNRLANLTYNRSSAAITLGNAMQVSGTITPTGGALATGGFLTLVSNASTTGRIASGSGSYITGNVTAERFIPVVARRWRFVSSPVIGTTLDDWQNEIYITGVGGTSNGFDATISNQAGVYSYDESVITGDYNTGWDPATNINNAIVTGKGYRVFVRGDRSDPGRLDGTNSTQNMVTMNLIGNVHTGNISMPVTFTSSGTTANDGWNLLGNPYPSQIDWNLIHDGGRTGSNPDFSGTDYAHLAPTVSVYDPNTNAYSSYNANLNSGTGTLSSGIIPSGAAFFVKATAASPSLTLKESHKSGSTPAAVFKTQPDYFRVFLVKDSINKDEMILAFKDEAVDSFDQFDIQKMYGGEVNIAAQIFETEFLTADVKPFNGKSDTTRLSIGITNTGSYTLEFNDPALLVSGARVWLIDQYTHQTQSITAKSSYRFNVDVNNAATKGNHRFMIVVGEIATGLDATSNSGPNRFEVFPTVTSDEITLLTPGYNGTAELKVTDVAGRVIADLGKQTTVSERIVMNMGALPTGNYFLTMKGQDGLEQVFRFIKN